MIKLTKELCELALMGGLPCIVLSHNLIVLCICEWHGLLLFSCGQKLLLQLLVIVASLFKVIKTGAGSFGGAGVLFWPGLCLLLCLHLLLLYQVHLFLRPYRRMLSWKVS